MSSLGRLKPHCWSRTKQVNPFATPSSKERHVISFPSKQNTNTEKVCVDNKLNANESNSAKAALETSSLLLLPMAMPRPRYWGFLEWNKISPSPQSASCIPQLSLSSALWTSIHPSLPLNTLFHLMKTEKAVRNIDAFNISGTKGTVFSRSKEISNVSADFIALQYEGSYYCGGEC